MYTDDENIKDEIFSFFLAGMGTIQVTTTNLIYFITKFSESKEKLMREIRPPVDQVKEGVKEGLTYDTVMDFEYLHECFYETLRLDGPTVLSMQ